MRGRYNANEPSLTELVAQLQKRVADLESGNRIGATSIDKGNLVITNGALKVGNAVYFGYVTTGSDATMGWIFRRADGSPVFSLQGNNAADQYWAMRDNVGNIIFSDDGDSNVGIGRPWLPVPWVPSSGPTPPTETTTSGTFTALLSSRFIKQHPKLYAQVLVRASDGSTSGEVQIAVSNGGDVIGNVATVGLGYYGLVTITGNLTGAHMTELELEVQARRTAGAGTIGVRMFGCYARQS